jgi:hypothetical protein
MNAMRVPNCLLPVLGALVLSSAALSPSLIAQVPAVPEVAEQTADQAWSYLKDNTYDQRDQFLSGVNRLSARLDDQIRALRAKRAGMSKDTTDWDFAMKDVDESRSLLTSRITELKATNTPETWLSARDNIGDAWKRCEDAVDKMHTTVTS